MRRAPPRRISRRNGHISPRVGHVGAACSGFRDWPRATFRRFCGTLLVPRLAEGVDAMRSAVMSLVALLSFAAVPAGAQPAVPAGPDKVVTGAPSLPSVEPLSHSAISSADTGSVIPPALRSPNPPPDAVAIDYLRAAQSALADGQTGRAQSALKNAETLLLARSVPSGAAGVPDQGATVSNIEV